MFTTKYMKAQPKKPTQKFSRGGKVAGTLREDEDRSNYYSDLTAITNEPEPDLPMSPSEQGRKITYPGRRELPDPKNFRRKGDD